MGQPLGTARVEGLKYLAVVVGLLGPGGIVGVRVGGLLQLVVIHLKRV